MGREEWLETLSNFGQINLNPRYSLEEFTKRKALRLENLLSTFRERIRNGGYISYEEFSIIDIRDCRKLLESQDTKSAEDQELIRMLRIEEQNYDYDGPNPMRTK